MPPPPVDNDDDYKYNGGSDNGPAPPPAFDATQHAEMNDFDFSQPPPPMEGNDWN